MRFSARRILTGAAGLAGAGLLALGLAGPASAQTTPQLYGGPVHAGAFPQPGFAPEDFTLTVSGGPVDFGQAMGPIRGFFTDTESAAGDSGIWRFNLGSVEVFHSPVNINPNLNPFTCTAPVFARGRWELAGRTGLYRFADGFGTFDLQGRIRAPRLPGGRCDLNDITLRALVFGQGIARV